MPDRLSKTERLQVTLAVETADYLRELAKTGTYGAMHTQVARALIEEGVRQAIKAGYISVRRTAGD